MSWAKTSLIAALLGAILTIIAAMWWQLDSKIDTHVEQTGVGFGGRAKHGKLDLQQIVNHGNLFLPLMFNDQLRLDSMSLIDGGVAYDYTFVNLTTEKLSGTHRSEQTKRILESSLARAFSAISDASEEAGGTPALPGCPSEAAPDDGAQPAMTQDSVKML